MQTYHIQAEEYQTEQILILGVVRGKTLTLETQGYNLQIFFHQTVQSRTEGSNI